MFKSKKEFAQALMDGRKFKIPLTDEIAHFDEKGKGSPFYYDNDKMKAAWDYYDGVEEILPWYSNIPEKGILCWIDINKSTAIRIIELKDGLYRGAEGGYYNSAVPVTEQESLEYIYRG